ncbi:hypothetical protein [Roseateles koreensis]|uniref:Big-1 domain-containing protein n=1 Tax=Roseateles koreensis TaxID=2987526 RepID=A0ABT5KT11_9BURK|nr:hypothetical protein [Roseateles koreensis]MDC8785483.1 hypothetical protein [Roseateles koreensis]
MSDKKFSIGHGLMVWLGGAICALALTACGGGGSAGTPILGTGTTTGSTGTTTDSAVVTISLSSTTVTAGAPATVTVNVKNVAGTALAGQVVKFSSDASMAAFSAPSALTDGNGVATVILSPAVATSTGADTVKATVSYLGKDYSGSTGFQLTATNVTIASFTSDVTGTLSAYGQANLTVTLAGTVPSSPVNLVLTSSCASLSKGTLTPASQSTSTGTATFTFRDGGCGASQPSDNLQVSVTGTALTKSLTLPVSSPAVTSIGFVSAAPTNIFLKGSGYVENSNVTFVVKDANNNGVPGQDVVLEPSVLVGGLTLDGSNSAVTKKTDSTGQVIVRINSGTVPTPVRVKATLANSNISTVSSSLAIAVGLPSQLGFSVAQGTINIEGYDIQGTSNTYTVIASDRLANAVPDGTAVNFISESGQVQATKQTALDASGIATATVNFKSAAPIPADGRMTVLAYALGEKSFLDVNGNNVYDTGEDFQDLGDIFLNRKFNGTYDAAADQYISLSTGASGACATSTSTLLARDTAAIPVVPNTCSGAWGRAYVRRAVQTILSTSAANPVWGKSWPKFSDGTSMVAAPTGSCPSSITRMTSYDAAGNMVTSNYYPFGTAGLYGVGSSGALAFMASDANSVAFNPMAAGTTVGVAATDGLTVGVIGGSPVPSTANPTAVLISYKFTAPATSGTISVTFTSPSGLATTVGQYVTSGAMPAGFSACN